METILQWVLVLTIWHGEMRDAGGPLLPTSVIVQRYETLADCKEDEKLMFEVPLKHDVFNEFPYGKTDR